MLSIYISDGDVRHYYGYAIFALMVFSFMGTSEAQTVMVVAEVSLFIIKRIGISKLRHEISFNLKAEEVTLQVEPVLIERSFYRFISFKN